MRERKNGRSPICSNLDQGTEPVRNFSAFRKRAASVLIRFDLRGTFAAAGVNGGAMLRRRKEKGA